MLPGFIPRLRRELSRALANSASPSTSSQKSSSPEEASSDKSTSLKMRKRSNLEKLRRHSRYAPISSLAESIAILNDPSPRPPATPTAQHHHHSTSTSSHTRHSDRPNRSRRSASTASNISLTPQQKLVHVGEPSEGHVAKGGRGTTVAAMTSGQAPNFAPSLLAWIGGSLAGALKTGGEEILRERYEAALEGGDADGASGGDMIEKVLIGVGTGGEADAEDDDLGKVLTLPDWTRMRR